MSNFRSYFFKKAQFNALFYLVVSALITLITLRILKYYDPSYLMPDAQNVYLPFAQDFLKNTAAFLQDPRSIYVGFLTYALPAALGLDIVLIKSVYIGLFVVSLMLWVAAFELAKLRLAAVMFLLLIYLHKKLLFYIPQVLTEPILFFALSLFIFAFMLAAMAKTEQTKRRFLAGCLLLLACLISLLTRPTYSYLITLLFYGSILVLLFNFIVHKRKQQPIKPMPLWALLCIVFGLCVLLMQWISIKHAEMFNFKGLQTGAGIALYYGVHPIYLGFEPTAINADYDHFFLSNEMLEHLHPKKDKAILTGTSYILKEMQMADWLHWGILKFKTLLFSAEYPINLKFNTLAFLRIFACLGFLWLITHLRTPLTYLLGALLFYKGAVVMGVMLTNRYLYFEIDPIFIAIIAVIVAVLVKDYQEKATQIRTLASSALLFLSAGFAYFVLAHYVIWQPKIDPRYTDLNGEAPFKILNHETYQVSVPRRINGNSMSLLHIEYTGKNPACRAIKFNISKQEETRLLQYFILLNESAGAFNIALPYQFLGDVKLQWQALCDEKDFKLQKIMAYRVRTAKTVFHKLNHLPIDINNIDAPYLY